MPDRRCFGKDALAGLPGAIGSVPDGMASAVLVGVNPVHGPYASFAGPVDGGLTASTRLEEDRRKEADAGQTSEVAVGLLLLRRGGEAQVAAISEDGRSLMRRLQADER